MRGLCSADMVTANLAFLDRFDPDAAAFLARVSDDSALVFPSRNGMPTLRYRDQLFHDIQDPLAEARALVGRCPQVLHVHFGLGLGYFLEVEELPPRGALIVYEPCLAVMRAVLAARALEPLFRGRRIKLCFNLAHLRYLILRCRGKGTPVRIFHSPAHVAMFPEEQIRFRREIEYHGPGAIPYSHLYPYIVRNTATNAPSLVTMPGCEQWVNRLTGKPGVVLSAGPSLSRNIAQLRPYRDRVVLFALARVVKTLEQHGMEPDFLVQVESQDFKHLIHGVSNLDRTVFLVADQVQPRFWWDFEDRTYWFLSKSNPLDNYLKSRYPHFRRMVIKTGGSVATAAFYLAFCFGCQPLILMGQDLAFSGGHYYVPSGDNLPYRTKRCAVNGLFGTKLASQYQYRQNLAWYERSIQVLRRMDPKRRFINATEGGARIEGFEHLKFREVAHRFLARSPLVSGPLAPAPWSRDADGIERFMYGLEEDLSRLNALRQSFDKDESSFLSKLVHAGEKACGLMSPASHFAGLGEMFNLHPALSSLFPHEWARLEQMSHELGSANQRKNPDDIYLTLWAGLGAVHRGLKFTIDLVREGLGETREVETESESSATPSTCDGI
ncbi:Motility associated factor glycosyltransferase family protein [Sulfidibacter corallicola]|uniref:Motility associated factor glycosyltransferase family protein n=1 Tax=Sulfidibacter corallicola TaxID=2818388 RepID=A0A8A4TUK5_SULCO|nr:6-hydroxymethylpterin diphosphokinase MptE-like protein [Sulfidibacter corallicola]QTD52818.1 motility associated factor glycosyltransferase family protein [Sulfidibacter corallicola]